MGIAPRPPALPQAAFRQGHEAPTKGGGLARRGVFYPHPLPASRARRFALRHFAAALRDRPSPIGVPASGQPRLHEICRARRPVPQTPLPFPQPWPPAHQQIAAPRRSRLPIRPPDCEAPCVFHSSYAERRAAARPPAIHRCSAPGSRATTPDATVPAWARGSCAGDPQAACPRRKAPVSAGGRTPAHRQATDARS